MSNCVCVCISYKSAVAAAFSFFFFFFFVGTINSSKKFMKVKHDLPSL